MKGRLLSLLAAVLLVSAWPVQAQQIGTEQTVSVVDSGTACSLANTCAVFYTAVTQAQSVTLTISGTFVGTLTFEVIGGGTNTTWFSVLAGKSSSSSAPSATTTTTGIYSVTNVGFLGLRARATAWTSGTATIAASRGLGSGGSGNSGGGGGAVTVADGADVTLGAKADAKSTATDTTAITLMQVFKEISFMEQNPASRAVTNAGTFAVQAAESGTWNITNVSGTVSLPTLAATSTKQSDGTQKAQIVDGSGNVIASTSNALNVNVNNGSSTGADNSTNGTSKAATLGGVANAAVPSWTETNQVPLSVDLTGRLRSNIQGIAGTTPISAGVAGALAIGGCVATNTATPCNPVGLGAIANSSEPSAATTAREVTLIADLVGKLIVLPYANPENFVSGAITSAMTGTTSTSLVASPGGSLRNYLTNCVVTNAHATVGTDVVLQDGSGGTTLYTLPAAAVYGGTVVSFPTPLRQPTTATAIYAQNVTTGASTKISCSGYKGL